MSESKLVKITFDAEKLGVSLEDTCIFGIQVKANKDGKLVGQCEPEIKAALVDAKKAK